MAFMNEQPLTTDRLLLRRWKTEDLDPYAELCADPEVMRWIGSGVTRTRDECAEAIEKFEIFWEQNGFGLFAVELRGSHQFIGFTGLAIPAFLPEVMPSIEIGWRLARHAWGKGYATEAAKNSLDFGFKKCGIQRFVSIHQVGNDASGRIMEKMGMSLYLDTIDPSCDRLVRVYEIHSE